MPFKLDSTSKGFADQFADLLTLKRESSSEVSDVVAAIIADVIDEGDEALFRYTEKFDGVSHTTETLAVAPSEIEDALAECARETLDALELAAERIKSFHERQLPEDDQFIDHEGVGLGQKWTAVGAVGLYVPGGQAAYPSSVLMNAIPARVAGVDRVAMVVPTPNGVLNPLVLAAAHTAGVTEILKIGGAQAVAALAYGTDSVDPVDKIVGPGNAFVAAAKRQVFGKVGIDMIAGPSEILVVADAENNPDWIAADLLSQAEHDASSQSILITDDEPFCARVRDAVERQLASLPRGEIARQSWQDFGATILVPSLDAAVPLVDALAPEHLELALADDEARRLSQEIRNAGAIFLGRYTPEAIGDYVAGTNHVLPTARSARFSSGLSVYDFMKRTSIVHCRPDGLAAIGGAAVTLAEAEGFDAHARSVAIRLNR